ncbi:PTS sugar transporter subunit IIA [Oenococcus oeni]|uniref:PTS glucose transporter subunit IIA n=1 Tax=Oenococcus oeni TaxID=1247 RepID=A0AAJ2P2V5_OENOE|nr:PTS glucose transporter subunit IIA [Oenococcus oeni]MDV7686958.1 PTS glucose transporter subunit IIA [Oenococcus oeni]MDV7715109.1 PTS glucose transporter subunit IIA [Oenococcus oeni]OIK57748.1 PTS sugar transporter subunit IIA [Oenococcus oeni]OIK88387.1 PTS sugar transporter subunit IIA [Oenococcus oeni]OIL10368.1 PTS sugar transporter subunit IIA [Oenococcus oeni]
MFAFLNKNKHLDKRIVAPVTGKCVDLSKVPDPLFAKKVMGDGAAFIYDGDTIFSPCQGSISMIASTKHAIGLMSISGIEILLHVGIDTVNLHGEGFTTLVSKDEKVKIGRPLLRINRNLMKEKKIDLITSLVVTNGSSVDIKVKNIGTQVTQGLSEIIVEKNGDNNYGL